MNADTFSKIASGLQNIAVVIGFCIGGWWALETFIFQYPAFYTKGGESAGNTPEAVKVEIDAAPLDQSTRQYEILLTVTNSSKTSSQVVLAEDLDVIFFKPGETAAGHAKFMTSLSVEEITVPVNESRVIHLFGQFPSDGIFVVEANLCKSLGTNCLAQKYVSTKTQGLTLRSSGTPQKHGAP